ncbi:hypothetical protein SAMN05421640_2634 [Ekhidna lutea]|uniref:Uncharacterized protein n=1 Tax=Ekhidna lutea TaxID=447679 RepID=A0A239KHF1_EKHLU|nr:hypothetical protein [Ekhidna lutea]SNT17049.1 hypothetical protein SAMN05421640_2634 [Ekhidna lutea]
MELIALAYIILGITVCTIAHLSAYGETYAERVPVIFRLNSLKRWLKSILNLVKI